MLRLCTLQNPQWAAYLFPAFSVDREVVLVCVFLSAISIDPLGGCKILQADPSVCKRWDRCSTAYLVAKCLLAGMPRKIGEDTVSSVDTCTRTQGNIECISRLAVFYL
jgi:hypothetical protein